MFIFYDTETSGLGKDFTQILQIALVFTDDNLNILSTKKVECRRAPWIIPSPGALLTTGFTPDDLKKSKNSQYQMMHEVDQWVRSQYMPVIFAGYNTFGYDEAVLAQNFHQTLLPTGLTTEKTPNGANGRFDVMTLVKAAALYMPGLLTLETLNEYGSPSLALVAVAQQNGVHLPESEAHDAMNDIKATIGVARLIQKGAPDVWDQMERLSTVAGVEAFMAEEGMFTLGLLVSGKSRSCVGTHIATQPGSQTDVVFDLSADPQKYLGMTVEELADCMSFKQARNHPFKMVDKAAQPILMPVAQSAPVLPADFDEAVYAARMKTLRDDPAFAARVAAAAALAQQKDQKYRPPAPDLPETQMGKAVPADVAQRIDTWVHEFKQASTWEDAREIADGFQTRFAEDLQNHPHIRRFAQFARRIILENAPEAFTPAQQEEMKRHIAERLLDGDLNAPYMTIARARKELEDIERERAEGRARWQNVTDTQVRALKLYYTAIEREYAPYAPSGASPAPETPVPPRKPEGPAP